MKWFNKLPPEFRHLLSSIITALILAQSVKYGYITQEQAATIPAPSVSISTPIQ